MTIQLFEFSEKELIDLLIDKAISTGKLAPADVTCSLTAERTKPFGKGFKVTLRVEEIAHDRA